MHSSIVVLIVFKLSQSGFTPRKRGLESIGILVIEMATFKRNFNFIHLLGPIFRTTPPLL